MDINIYPSPPLSFVRSGYTYLPNASLRAFGQDGDYWSSVAHELVNLTWATAWFLGNYAGSIDSNGTTNARSFGFPIRCLAY